MFEIFVNDQFSAIFSSSKIQNSDFNEEIKHARSAFELKKSAKTFEMRSCFLQSWAALI